MARIAANFKLVRGAESLAGLRHDAASCRACHLWKHATQTVLGKGPSRAKIVLVGQQPGDKKEDIAGHPFVGPAGKLLNMALAAAGIKRSEVYITNLVKHFKWELSANGKTHIGKEPVAPEIQACRPWLDAELKVIKPHVLILLGSTAAHSLVDKTLSITRQHGQLIDSPLARLVLATLHPSPVLRARGKDSREAQMRLLIQDFIQVKRLLKEAA